MPDLQISESYIWTYRDSFYQFLLNPKNYWPGLVLGVVSWVIVVFFTRLDSNPLLSFAAHVVFVMILFVVGSLIWEYLQFKKMPEDQKSLHWAIGEDSLVRTDGAGRSSTYKWNRIRRVKRTLSGYMLHPTSGPPVWVSIKLFTPDQAETFEVFLDESNITV